MVKQLFFIVWMVIDILLIILSLPILRKEINGQPNKIGKGIIYTEKNALLKVSDVLLAVSYFVAFVVIIYVILFSLPDEAMQSAINWFKGVFIVSLFPLIITWITTNKVKPSWYIGIIFLGVTFSFVCHFVKTDDIKIIQKYKVYLSLLLSIFFVSFILLIIKAIKSRYIVNKLHTHFYEDIIYRTPRINVKMNKIELVKMCEKFYYQYIRRLKKVSDVERIEFVNLNGYHRNKWYRKTADITRKFIYFSIIFLVIELHLNYNIWSIMNIIFIYCFVIIINILKKKDMNFLERIAIRVFYEEWGYCLYCSEEKYKFVGVIQVMDLKKYHKYIHSFLDIAALCRAIALIDEIENGDNIKLISNTFNELIDNYQEEYVENVNWIGALPLWVSTMFEYKVHQEIPKKIKQKLNQYYIDEKVMHEINLFISGFWVHMTKTMPGKQISSFVSGFVDCIRMSKE